MNDRHPNWNPTTARLVAGLGWTVVALALLLVFLGAAEGDVVLSSLGGAMVAMGAWLALWGRRIRRELTRSRSA